MAEPEWVELAALLPLHSKSIAAHGGVEGLRDRGLLESALQRPINRYHYEGVRDLHELAATYAVAVSSNHTFLDGNKRASFLCLLLFLRSNGIRLIVDQVEATRTMYSVAAGQMTLEALSDWVQAHSAPA